MKRSVAARLKTPIHVQVDRQDEPCSDSEGSDHATKGRGYSAGRHQRLQKKAKPVAGSGYQGHSAGRDKRYTVSARPKKD